MTTLDNRLIHNAAAQQGCRAEIVQETRILWCGTWQTYMPHTRTSQGWVCACGELAEDLGTRAFIDGGEVRELPLLKTDNEDLPF